MHPELIKIGPFPIHTYGFLIAVGFIISAEVLRVLSNRAKLDTERVLEAAYWSLLVGLLGARMLFIITQWSEFSRDPAGIFRIWEGGLVFLGGPILVVPFLVWYLKKYKVPIWPLFDIAAPALAIGHVFGRLGCLAAGCCYGKPTGTWFGVKLYSNIVEPHLQGIPLHPTQLYEAGSLLILFFGLLFIGKRKVFEGQVALSYLIAYPVIRSIIEVYRGDIVRGFVIEDVLSTSQFISIFVFIGAVGVLIFRLKQVQKEALQEVNQRLQEQKTSETQ
jgi:phosphatidylglycerol:prolipoprotein diacylglycerol transferase